MLFHLFYLLILLMSLQYNFFLVYGPFLLTLRSKIFLLLLFVPRAIRKLFNINYVSLMALLPDNLAPQTADYVIKLWASLKQQFPNAAIKASSLDEFSQHLWTFKDNLPVVTSEMGDTWLYGIGADPFR